MKTQLGVDVVVVGSGGAGFRSAIGAAQKGCNVVLLSKGKATRSGASPMAGGGLMGDIDTDGPSLKAMGFPEVDASYTSDVWFKDIVLAGGYLSNQTVVRRHIEESPQVLRELIDWGAKVFGRGQSSALSIQGRDMMDVLARQAISLNVKIVEDFVVTDIVSCGDVAKGCVGYDAHSGESVYWPSKVVIIATGGLQGLYEHNSGSSCCVGDGFAMAHRAGANLQNMEMIEFCPNTIVKPEIYKGSIVTYVLSAYGGVDQLNGYGEPFIENYFQGKAIDLALNSEWNKMLCSYAMYKEGVSTGGIRLKVRPDRLGEAYKRRHYLKQKASFFEEMSDWDIVSMPAAHYMAGGVEINGNCETGVVGLLVSGEAASAVFGANRVSSALTEMLTLGKIAGDQAGSLARSLELDEDVELAESLLECTKKPFDKVGEENPKEIFKLEERIKKTMHRNVNVVKSEESLQSALKDCEVIRDSFDNVRFSGSLKEYYNPWLSYLNVRSMLDVAEIMIRCSLLREESRGVFVREDKFFTDNVNWLKNTLVKPNGEIGVKTPDLKELKPDFEVLGYLEAIHHLAEEVE